MNKSDDKQGEAQKEPKDEKAKKKPFSSGSANSAVKEKEPRCDSKQLALLKKCSEKKDISDWNTFREQNPDEEIWLEGAGLIRAHLEGAYLRYAHLEGALLMEAHLKGVSLEDAHLEGAGLIRAHLEGANLSLAHLKRANVSHAHLERAWCSHAHLEGALLNHAHLEGAWFSCAHLEGTQLVHAHLEGTRLPGAYLEGADLYGAHLKGAELCYAHLERADLYGAHIEGTIFQASVVDGSTLFWNCSLDRKTDFRGVGLESCRIDEPTKYLLEYNRRRMNCEDWYKEHPRLVWPVKAFFWMSDYGNSTWRIIKTFFFIAICFAIAYYIWGAVDYYLLGITDHPGIVANLFIDKQRPIICWLVLLRSIYFSIVTMTTLGFGDMYANAHNYWFAAAFGHLLLGLQVLFGYVMLGALVTRFGVLFHSGVISGEFTESKMKSKSEQ